jgi:hypothetical protein
MLSSANDRIKEGDYVLVPNITDSGFFILVEVIGEYDFSPLILSPDTDVNKLGQDYGHILPVRLITKDGVNKYAENVHADLRSTLRTQSLMWSLDNYSAAIEQLIAAQDSGTDLTIAQPGEARLESAWESAVSHASSTLQARLMESLNERFRAAEWEKPIARVLTQLYPMADVICTGGPKEQGADIVIKIPNRFGVLPWIIAVQIKNYSGQIGADVLSQLERAYNHYCLQGIPLSLVIMTTAENTAPDFHDKASVLAKKIGVTIDIVLRDQLVKILTEGLVGVMYKQSNLQDANGIIPLEPE